MTERNQVHAAAKRALHAPPALVYKRIENRVDLGTPDVAYCLLGVSGWVEEKLFPTSGRCPGHLTQEQVMWGEEWSRAGGLWWLVGRRGAEWVAYSAIGARMLLDGRENAPALIDTGAFPRARMLALLAPQGMRRLLV